MDNQTTQHRIAIAATFTCDPVRESLQFWLTRLALPASVEIAPYDQAFQQLLDPSSLFHTNSSGVNVLLVRLGDWHRDGAIVDDFVRALASAKSHLRADLLIVTCPDSPDVDPATSTAAEQHLTVSVAELSGVHLLSAGALLEQYPVDQVHDPQGERLANIPYTPTFFSALGSAVARHCYGLLCPPHKVLVLDCDDTLWGGLCSELGPLGVSIEPSHLALQRFAKRQQQAGRLVCVASRNNEADVREVFESNPAMLLGIDDITAWQVHWGAKSDSLMTLAQDLGLGLSSFVFIDDDPMQCAEVSQRLPEVLALPLPAADQVAQFCQQIWPLDIRQVTTESEQRTQAYRDHAEREQLRRHSLSLAEFLDSLELTVQIDPLSEADLARASELTHRTNQFNLTGAKYSEAQLAGLLGGGAERAFVVRVRDRFGDYGLVGLMIVAAAEQSLTLPVFLLSCRALGRGVEHQMLAFAGREALDEGLGWTKLHCNPTAKNQPAQAFLTALGASSFSLELSAAAAEQVKLQRQAEADVPVTANIEQPTQPIDLRQRLAMLATIPTELATATQIHQAIAPGLEPLQAAGDGDPVETMLLSSFSELLGVTDLDVDTGFFDLGGHSLQAVQVLAKASTQFDIELDPTLLFTTNFTVAELSAEIDHLRDAKGQYQGVGSVLDQLSALTDG